MWWKVALLVISGLIAAVGIAVLYGAARWRSGTKALRAQIEAARVHSAFARYGARELGGLPAPVQRYFRAVLKDGQPIVAAANVRHTGTFNMSETGEQWKPFTSTQRVITRRPGFDWDGRIAMAPGLAVYVHDAYVAGEGILHATLLGLVTVVHMRGTPEVAQGELMRFLAEAAWYPTALLPGQGIRWEAVDDTSAKATLKDGDIAVTLLFRFSAAGPIQSVRAEARGRTVNGRVVATPWEGHWQHHELRDGMLVPLEGEVAWVLPEGPKPYWRGRITGIDYEFAR